jgi:hypothetical protein
MKLCFPKRGKTRTHLEPLGRGPKYRVRPVALALIFTPNCPVCHPEHFVHGVSTVVKFYITQVLVYLRNSLLTLIIASVVTLARQVYNSIDGICIHL